MRPSAIYFFAAELARRTSDDARNEWLKVAFRPGFRPVGKRWYADTSRESIRDDLIRIRLLSMGIVGRVSGIATTSSAPVYFLRSGFAGLFDPALTGLELTRSIDVWRRQSLSPAALAKMALKAQGMLAQKGDVVIDLPDGSRMRVAAGPSAPILEALIEAYAPRWLEQPALLWVSASDRKTQPHFVNLSASVGLRFDPQEMLPDLILADLGTNLRFVFCAIVATDGPIDEDRRAALLAISRHSGIGDESGRFVTAYLEREATALRKTFHRAARDSDLWFTTEPDLIVRLLMNPRRL